MAGAKGKSGRKSNELVVRQNLLRILDETDPVSGRKKMLRVLHSLVNSAMEGDLGAINAVMDRVDGKPKQAVEHGGPDGGGIPISEVTFRVVDPTRKD